MVSQLVLLLSVLLFSLSNLCACSLSCSLCVCVTKGYEGPTLEGSPESMYAVDDSWHVLLVIQISSNGIENLKGI